MRTILDSDGCFSGNFLRLIVGYGILIESPHQMAWQLHDLHCAHPVQWFR